MIAIALDTATESIACALARIDAAFATFELLGSADGPAPRAANTQLVDRIDGLCKEAGLTPEDVDLVICGRGPGSFTGTRIAVATAKGIAAALRVPLHGVSTLDSIAWNLLRAGITGRVGVVADAMRGEVYPVRFLLSDAGDTAAVERLEHDAVIKPAALMERWATDSNPITLAGNGLVKYAQLIGDAYAEAGNAEALTLAPEDLWLPTGAGLVEAYCAQLRSGNTDSGDPSSLLPVYTRLSDAEENERKKAAQQTEATVPANGVNEIAAEDGLVLRPMNRADVPFVAALEKRGFTDEAAADAWSEGMLADEVGRPDRIWWVALERGVLRGAAGAWVIDGDMQVLDVVVDEEARRQGVATRLLARLDEDGRALGAQTASLEVRAGNEAAKALYARVGFTSLGKRPHYYPDGTDALILKADLPLNTQVGAHEGASSVAGMELSDVLDLPSLESHPRPLILAIESSCDETGAAIIDGEGALGSDLIASQISFHARFGGVVPEIASRKHIEAIVGVCDEALVRAGEAYGAPGFDYHDLDAVAVTTRPGLVGALVVGIAFAKGVAWAISKPLIDVNHLEGHLFANRLITPDIEPPMVALLVSGGHTMLVHVKDWGDYETMGSTLDDAVGEAFDKVAKALGLGYPGGPIISKLAAKGDPKAIDFPRAMMHSGDLRFSLSGLKTAVITYIHNGEQAGRTLDLANIAASFQQAVVDVLVAKTVTALEQTGAREFCLGGGVAANPELRDELVAAIEKRGVRVTLPQPSACTDNAGMIAQAALAHYEAGAFAPLSVDAAAHAPLDQENWRG